MLELTETTFADALKDALNAGIEMERQRIIESLNQDAVISTNVPTQWLTYIVELIENV